MSVSNDERTPPFPIWTEIQQSPCLHSKVHGTTGGVSYPSRERSPRAPFLAYEAFLYVYEPFSFFFTCIQGCASLWAHRLRGDLTTSTHTSPFPFPLARKKTRHHFIISEGQLHRAVRADSASLRFTLPQRYTFSSTHTYTKRRTKMKSPQKHT